MTDFLIIGGGIAGLSAGAALSTLGQVTVLEGEDALGHHSSGRSAAMFEPTYGLPSTVALNQASADFFHGSENLLTPRGLMMVGLAGEEDAFSAGLKSMSMRSIEVEEAREFIPVLNPDVIKMAGYHKEAWDIDTDLLMQSFARQIRQTGGQILTRHKVSEIKRQKNGWAVHVGKEEFSARRLVNAAGAWADEIARLAGIAPIGIQPFRRSIARVAAPEGHDVSRWPMLFGPGETWYMKPDAGCLLISPADEVPVEPHDAWAEDMTLATGIAMYEERVTMPVTRMVANWAGLRSFAPDRNLVIGTAPDDDSFLWMAAQGGYGFQTAPAASRFLADIAGGKTPELDDATRAALSPARFS
ncbi:MAG: FAD-binding oxidoreductase [Rhodobacteraceae bacterium]|nr:FAD-binding oxidoreductase [Paracoccaceae bacterium]